MTLTPTATRVDALLAVLDEDIRYAQTSLSLLDTLRSLLIKRDEAALEGLLNDLHREAEAHAHNERQRDRLRQELADELQCGIQEITLSRLKDRLSGERQTAVSQRQTRLKSLTGDLKREYTLTAMLLADCAQFNRALMRVFFGLDGKGNLMYGANGAAKHRAGTALVNMHF